MKDNVSGITFAGYSKMIRIVPFDVLYEDFKDSTNIPMNNL